MATLTTSWQNLGSAKLDTNITIYLDGKYSEQNVENNTTTVQFRLRSGGNRWRTQSGTASFTGAFSDSKSCATYPNYIESGDTVYSISKTVTHNTNGEKSLNIGGKVIANIPSTKTATISNRSVTIPKINRLATVVSTEDFTDEGNPTLTFDNPAGFDVYPYLTFYDNNNNLVYLIEKTPQNGDDPISNPYTWNITPEQRTAMRQATNQQSSYRVQVGVDTYDGLTKLGYNSVAKQMTYVNATPTQSTTYVETNAKVISVLNNDTSATYVVKNASNLTITSVPTTEKYATVSNVKVTQGTNEPIEKTTTPYTFTNVGITSNEFNVIVTDSRGLTDTFAKTYTGNYYVDYEPIDITSVLFERPAPTSDNVVLNAEIKYIQATFGSTTNVPTIKWKKGESGTENTISSSDYTIDTQNNKITITDLTLTSAISYQDEDRLYLLVKDLLTEDSDGNIVAKGIPTFDAGEHDFQVNGTLYIADTDRENAVNVLQKINDVTPKVERVGFTITPNETRGSCGYGTTNVDISSLNAEKILALTFNAGSTYMLCGCETDLSTQNPTSLDLYGYRLAGTYSYGVGGYVTILYV